MPDALVGNAGDAKQQARAKKRQKLRLTQWRSDVQAVLRTPAGRRVVWAVLEQCQLFGSAPSAEATTMTRFLGRRDVGLWLLLELEAVEPFAIARLKQDARSADAQEAAQADQTAAHEDGDTDDGHSSD